MTAEAPPASSPWADAKRFTRNNFDALRFFLAGLVIFAHSFALLSGTDDTEPLMIATHQMTFGGGVATTTLACSREIHFAER